MNDNELIHIACNSELGQRELKGLLKALHKQNPDLYFEFGRCLERVKNMARRDSCKIVSLFDEPPGAA